MGLIRDDRDHVAGSMDPFLLKPFKPAVLLEAVHRLLHLDALATR